MPLFGVTAAAALTTKCYWVNFVYTYPLLINTRLTFRTIQCALYSFRRSCSHNLFTWAVHTHTHMVAMQPKCALIWSMHTHVRNLAWISNSYDNIIAHSVFFVVVVVVASGLRRRETAETFSYIKHHMWDAGNEQVFFSSLDSLVTCNGTHMKIDCKYIQNSVWVVALMQSLFPIGIPVTYHRPVP